MSAAVFAKEIFRNFQEARQKKSYLQQIRDYRGFVPVNIETPDFAVRTAQTGNELMRVLKLRHEVFVEEWQGRRAYHGLDVDSFDFTTDHLMIIDKKNSEVVGTYRLLSSHFTKEFYSNNEFIIEKFLRLPAVKLELGRACVHGDYRNGAAIELLWQGLSDYITKTKTEFLFGCSSIKSTSPGTINRIAGMIRESKQWSDEFTIRPTEDYRFPDFLHMPADALSALERKRLLPPLLRSYLNAGALVYGWPALDMDFECTDMLTILDWKRLNPKFKARFVGV